MIRSPAFNVLSLAARKVLDRLEIEIANHGGNDNGQLVCTFSDFVSFGIDRHAIALAIRELCALGFVEVKRGGAGNREYRTPNTYRLTYRDTEHGWPTDEWKKVEDIDTARALARSARAVAPAKQQAKRAPLRVAAVAS